MAQFDVQATAERHTAGTPYVVVIQSARYDRRPTRVVIPLLALAEDRTPDRELMPRFMIEGPPVYLNPLRILTVPGSSQRPGNQGHIAGR